MAPSSCPIRKSEIPEPPWTRGLPRLGPVLHSGERTFKRPRIYQQLPAIPASKPHTTTGDDVNAMLLAFRRHCSICGCSLPKGAPVWHVCHIEEGGEGGPGWYEYPGGLFASWIPGPMHKSCALYSIQVCPFLFYPNAKRKHATEAPKPTRGPAAIVSFWRYGILFTEEVTGWGCDWLYAYWEQVDGIPFGASKELLPLYLASLVEDAKVINTATRIYWSDSDIDRAWRKQARDTAASNLKAMTRSSEVVGGHAYNLHAL